MGFLAGLSTVLLCAFIAFGLYTTITHTQNPSSILQNITAEPLKGGSSAVCYAIAYNSVTPALQHDWLPPHDTRTPVLEDLPLPDGSDFLGLGLAALLGILILRVTIFRSQLSGLAKIGLAALILAILIILAWLLIKFTMFGLMYKCGEGIGLTHEQITAGRDAAIAAFQTAGIAWPLMLFSTFSGLTYLRLFTGGKRE